MTPEQRETAIAEHAKTLFDAPSALSAERVNAIFLDCMLRDDEIADQKPKNPDDVRFVPGIIHNVGLHKRRLESHRAEIALMVNELDENYFVSSGSGGQTFLNLCNDRLGRQWTGFHRTMEEFCVLCMGLGFAVFIAPRIAWRVFEGSMPYMAFRREPLDEVGIDAWNEKLNLVTEDIEAGQAGDVDRASKGIQAMTAMIMGLK